MIERVQGATAARDLLLHRAMEYLDSLATEAAGDAPLQGELAAGYEKVGDLQGNPSNPNLIELDDAIASYVKARRIRERLLESRPGDEEQRRALAKNLRVLGNIRGQANDYDTAAQELAVALRSYDPLRAEHPGDETLTLAVAQTHHDTGRNLSASKRYAGALPSFRTAIAMGEAMRQSAASDLEGPGQRPGTPAARQVVFAAGADGDQQRPVGRSGGASRAVVPHSAGDHDR